MKEKRHRVARLLGALTDLPEAMFADLPEVTLFGGQEVQITRHHGVTEYSDTRIVVRAGDFAVEICGEELSLCGVDTEILAARGKIEQVRLHREARR